MTKEEIDEALLQENATKEHLDIGIEDIDWYVRAAVIKNPKATKEHLDIGIKDEEPFVRYSVIRRLAKNMTKDTLNKYFDTEYCKFLGTKEDWDSICLLYL